MDRSAAFCCSLLAISAVSWVLTRPAADESSFHDDKSKDSRFPSELVAYASDDHSKGQINFGLESVTNSIQKTWKESRALGRRRDFVEGMQSGGNYDFRPRRDLYKTAPRFDVFQPVVRLAFLGRFDLDRNQARLSFPIVVNRATGDTWVYAKNGWIRLEQWVVSKDGVHL